jgi:hypothetical protein
LNIQATPHRTAPHRMKNMDLYPQVHPMVCASLTFSFDKYPASVPSFSCGRDLGVTRLWTANHGFNPWALTISGIFASNRTTLLQPIFYLNRHHTTPFNQLTH